MVVHVEGVLRRVNRYAIGPVHLPGPGIHVTPELGRVAVEEGAASGGVRIGGGGGGGRRGGGLFRRRGDFFGGGRGKSGGGRGGGLDISGGGGGGGALETLELGLLGGGQAGQIEKTLGEDGPD